MDGNYKKLFKTKPLSFSLIDKYLGNNDFTILDVGCGNNSAVRTKQFYPSCKYYGVDINRDTNNDLINFELMENFYELDLTMLDYSTIPDNFFDVIVLTHVIEHLYNGDAVIPLLIKKIKIGGYIYIEYPSFKSTNLPSMDGTLNFFDDKTHVKLYSLLSIYNLLMKNNMEILVGGSRRRLKQIVLIPYYIIKSIVKGHSLRGSIFWDLFGFAEYSFAKKVK